MRRKLVIFAAVVLVAVGLFVSGWPYEIYMRTRAAQLRAEIERYNAAHGKYPVSLLDIAGAPVNGPIYYERDLESPEVYHLWFRTGLGTVSQYDSKTRTCMAHNRSNKSLEPTAGRCVERFDFVREFLVFVTRVPASGASASYR